MWSHLTDVWASCAHSCGFCTRNGRFCTHNGDMCVPWIPPLQVAPELYPYGSRGPVGAHYLAAKYNVRWGDLTEDEA